MFEVALPESATIEAWRGVTAKIMLLVRLVLIFGGTGSHLVGWFGRSITRPTLMTATTTTHKCQSTDANSHHTHASTQMSIKNQVRSINVKEEVAPDPRGPEEKLAAAREELTMKVGRCTYVCLYVCMCVYVSFCVCLCVWRSLAAGAGQRTSHLINLPNQPRTNPTPHKLKKAEHEARQAALAGYREALLASSVADTEKARRLRLACGGDVC